MPRYCYTVSYDLDKVDYDKGHDDILRETLTRMKFKRELNSQWSGGRPEKIDVYDLHARLTEILASPKSRVIVRQVDCTDYAL